MINPVFTSENRYSAAFSTFNKGNVTDNYGITTKFSTRNNNVKKQREDDKKGKYLGVKIATTALAAGFGIFLLMKGLPKSFYKKMDGAFKNLTDKIYTEESKSKTSKLTISYLTFLKTVKSVAGRAKALFNEGPIKFTLLLRGINKVKFLRKGNEWVTKQFEKIAVRKSRKFYEKANNRLVSTIFKFNDVNSELLQTCPNKLVKVGNEEKTVNEWVSIIKSKTEKVQKDYTQNFLLLKRKERLIASEDNLGTLHEKIWDMIFKNPKNFFKNKNLYQTFISEELAAEYKLDLIKTVNEHKKDISNDVKDTYTAIKTLIENIDSAPEDLNTRKCIKEIKQTLVKYKELRGANENAEREKVVETLTSQLGVLKNNIESFEYKPEFKDKANEYIEGVSKLISENKKGDLQEILTIYKQLCPKKYSSIKKNTYKFIHSLDKAINVETNKLFDKLRDIAIGSVPADMLTILSALGIVSYGLGKADNNDERVSVALKYGIPVVGAVLTSVLCTVGLVSGGYAIILGLVSGEVIHKAGKFADDQLKKYKKQQEHKLDIQKLNTMIENKTAQTIKIIGEPMKPKTN